MAQVIKRLLIANRGEIACRIERTCRTLGVETVALYTDEERELPHVKNGDLAVCLGSGPLSETYLNQQRLLEIARQYSCDAIHPGYGFLSENAQFARAVEQAGLIFVGPTADVIELMGDKKASKEKMASLNIPLIPGHNGGDQSEATLMKAAKEIGTPLLIKASAGGGGKGMRIVRDLNEFKESLEGAKREAMNAFGDDRVLIEKFLENPRHIEIQVFSDEHGNHLYLHERECSIQRRYQKVIEEAPSPAVSPELREKMGRDAVAITRALNYRGAGTLEFMLDEDGQYYFLEMNTRLQVEHPVTENITGIDLVAWQIKVANGQPLPLKQIEIPLQGHSIEVRLYAEDPDNHFLPCTGKLQAFGLPDGLDLRLDTGYESGQEVSTSFDPMVAKLISWGVDREEAREKLLKGLAELGPLGLKTNREFLMALLKHPSFVSGETTTKFIATHQESLRPQSLEDHVLASAIAAKLFGMDKVVSKLSTHKAQSAVGAWEVVGSLR